MPETNELELRRRFKALQGIISESLQGFKPPENLTVSEWADKYRILSSEASAEPGPWRTSRTPYMKEPMDAYTDPNVKRVTVVAASQVGKALDIGTKIPTPNGWVLMKDIETGDVVFDENGHPCNVTWTTEIMYDRPCIEMTFSDGSKVVCDAEHKWSVYKLKSHGEARTVLTAGEMISDYKKGNRNVYAIDVCKPIKCRKQDLPIPPYVLGYWLGDGNSASAQLTVAKEDAEIIDYIRSDGVETVVDDKADTTYAVKLDPKLPKFVDGRCIRGHLIADVGLTRQGYCAECHRQQAKHTQYGFVMDKIIERRPSMHKKLDDIGVLNNKHIPGIYLRASIEQRFELLQGLMDSDGYINNKGHCEITLKSERLINDTYELLSSLGIKAKLSQKTATCLYKGNMYSCPAYRLSFLVYDDKPVFRLRRKREKIVSREGRRTTEAERRRVVQMQPVETRPVRCISVDSPSHLYLAGETMIPTHNSEMLNNIIGYIIHQDPSSILLVEPNMIDAKKYSKLRIGPMIRDTPELKKLVASDKGRSSSNTMYEKAYPNGMLIMCGSTEAHNLASLPMKNLLGDERDRWATSAGKEGDPWKLAQARQTTFANAKSFECSTPTIKGASAIESSFYLGTQERWCSKCPHCETYSNIQWKDIRYSYEEKQVRNKRTFLVKDVYYVCPECGAISREHEMKSADAKWIAENPDAYKNGHRSFWLNAFISPWKSWESIILDYLDAVNDTKKLQVVYNTVFGELWEDRGDLQDEDEFLAKREEYPAELPDAVLVLTCGVDVQDDRLEYEVVGWGLRKECWGVKRGQIMGRPDDHETWLVLDDILDHVYRFKDGRGLKISNTFVDDGGHFTQYTRLECMQRIRKKVFDCKGFAGDGKPFTSPPKKVSIMIRGKYIGQCWQYQLGVDAGKQMIMDSLKIQSPGPRYCHFPLGDDRGYNHQFFVGLLSEHLVYKEHNRNPWVWEKIPGHERNEPLDCRNYAHAAFTALAPDLDALHRRANGNPVEQDAAKNRPQKPRKTTTPAQRLQDRMNEMMDW